MYFVTSFQITKRARIKSEVTAVDKLFLWDYLTDGKVVTSNF